MIKRTLVLAGLSALLLSGCVAERTPTVPEETNLAETASLTYVDDNLGITCTQFSFGKYAWGGCYASDKANLPAAETTRTVNLFMTASTINVDTDAGLVCIRFSGGKFGWGSCVPLNDLSAEARESLSDGAALRG